MRKDHRDSPEQERSVEEMRVVEEQLDPIQHFQNRSDVDYLLTEMAWERCQDFFDFVLGFLERYTNAGFRLFDSGREIRSSN